MSLRLCLAGVDGIDGGDRRLIVGVAMDAAAGGPGAEHLDDMDVAAGKIALDPGFRRRVEVRHAEADGKRNAFQERWLVTASTQFEEVLPSLAAPAEGQSETLAEYAWYNIPFIEASEDSYVEIYENMRGLKLIGINSLLICLLYTLTLPTICSV